jgi:Holliday junction resolvasome RuvABC endonuclease subunit
MAILGLDISTVCTGYSVLDMKGELLEVGFIELNRPPKSPPIFYDRAILLEERLKELEVKHDIRHVFIEEPIRVKGRNSNSNTIIKLLQLNGIVSLMCYRIFGVEPVHLRVTSARKRARVPQRRGDKDIKHKVFKRLTEELGYDVPVTKKRTGTFKDYVYDMSDSLLMAYVGFLRVGS